MIVRALRQIFAPAPFDAQAREAYVTLVTQARKPWFYTSQGIPDTLDGRFDVIILHMFLLIHRLRKESGEEAGQFIRALSETFFADMDRSLREMGSSDTGVGKRIKKMVQAFYGRLQAYEQGLHDPQLFADSLMHNLYRAEKGDTARIKAVNDYALRNIAHLAEQPAGDILTGKVTFSD